jgi:hypothetical protein
LDLLPRPPFARRGVDFFVDAAGLALVRLLMVGFVVAPQGRGGTLS